VPPREILSADAVLQADTTGAGFLRFQGIEEKEWL
jgi:hypothetical protein